MGHFNECVIEDFRARKRVVGARGTNLILVHHREARTGTQRVNPAMSLRDGDGWLVVGSAMGAPRDPTWAMNLRAHPDTVIEAVVGDGVDIVSVHAVELSGAEREEAFRRLVQLAPELEAYQAKAGRLLPVFRLAPRVAQVGFVGLGDQGLPMAVAIAKAGFALHSWARRPASLDALGSVAHTPHATLKELAAASELVALCVSTDDDVFQLLDGGILDALRPGSIVVNHGTGTPANARRMTQLGARAGVEVLDAPISGGRPAAEERRLTTMVGGTAAAAGRAEPVFAAFSRHVVHLGQAGSGQMAKLLNNALLMMNQAAVADIVTLADELRLDPVLLVEVLKVSSASSAALTLLNTMVRPDNVDHLSRVEALDMQLFDQAMRDAGAGSRDVTARGLAGARRLPALLRRLNPDTTVAAPTGGAGS